jgi:hypothetical protein
MDHDAQQKPPRELGERGWVDGSGSMCMCMCMCCMISYWRLVRVLHWAGKLPPKLLELNER